MVQFSTMGGGEVQFIWLSQVFPNVTVKGNCCIVAKKNVHVYNGLFPIYVPQ